MLHANHTINLILKTILDEKEARLVEVKLLIHYLRDQTFHFSRLIAKQSPPIKFPKLEVTCLVNYLSFFLPTCFKIPDCWKSHVFSQIRCFLEEINIKYHLIPFCRQIYSTHLHLGIFHDWWLNNHNHQKNCDRKIHAF